MVKMDLCLFESSYCEVNFLYFLYITLPYLTLQYLTFRVRAKPLAATGTRQIKFAFVNFVVVSFQEFK